MQRSSKRIFARLVIAAALLMPSLGPAVAGGAIAVGSCATFGYAYDFGDLGAARTAALTKCSDSSCKVALTMKRACGALAIDGKNACGAYGYAVAPRLGQAQNTALRECHKFGGHDCVIRAWACDAKG